MNDFDRKIRRNLPEGLVSGDVSILQINLGRHCNLSCRHCHLECSPQRREQMTQTVMEGILAAIGGRTFERIDITGGSPELHPHFQPFLEELCAKGHPVQVRTNLTNLAEPPLSDLIPFFRGLRVSLVGSLPCYEKENVDLQRGPGVHEKSIAALRLLNCAGYGIKDGLPLNLVYNPGGAFLPPPQTELEGVYREELGKRFGVGFSRLLVLTNMPIGRFGRQLKKEGEADAYLQLLKDAFNPATLAGLMCLHQISVDWDGRLYDCDFNLALRMPVNHGSPNTLAAMTFDRLARRSIVTGKHCFGCTAGAGSSCSGSLAPPSASTQAS